MVVAYRGVGTLGVELAHHGFEPAGARRHSSRLGFFGTSDELAGTSATGPLEVLFCDRDGYFAL